MAMMKSALNVEKRVGVDETEWTLESAAHARRVLVGLYVEKCKRDDDEIEGGAVLIGFCDYHIQ